MNPPNTPPESPESLDGKKKKQPTALEALKNVLDTKVDMTDPQFFNAYEENTGDFTSRLRRLMKEEKIENLSDKDIDNLGSHEIANEIALRARKLVSQRSRLHFLIKSTYSKLRNDGDFSVLLKKGVNALTLTELEFYIKNIKRTQEIARFLENAGLPAEEIVPEAFPPLKMREIFHDADTLGLSDINKKFLARIIEHFERYKTLPDTKDIKDLLFLYKNTSSVRKRELLIALDASLPLSLAREYNLLTENEVGKIFESYFGKIYSSLENEEKKKEFRDIFLSQSPFGDEIIVPFAELGHVNMDLLFHDRSRLDSTAKSILDRLSREEKIRESTSADILAHATQEFPNEDDHHVVFRKYVAKKLSSAKTGLAIPGIENLKEGSIIEFEENGQKQYFKLLKTHDENGLPVDVNGGLSVGVIIEALPVENGYMRRADEGEVTYDKFYEFFEKHRSDARVLTDTQFQAMLTKDKEKVTTEGKLYDARDLDSERLSHENILAKLDTADAPGRKYGLSDGTYFAVKDQSGMEHVWKVLSVSEKGVKVLSPGGTIEDTLSYEFLSQIIEGGKIRRVSKIQSDDDLVAALQEHTGLLEGAYIDDRELFQKNRDKDGKDKADAIRVFEGKDDHIRIDGITDGMVAFSEYEELSDEDAAKLAKNKNHKIKGRYKMKTLSYGAFVEYLKDNKLKASTKKPKGHHEAHSTHDHGGHDDHSHLHGSFWSRLGKMQTIGSMWKGLEMVWHSIEHTLEKGTKLDAARFAMKVGKFIPIDSVNAQIYADIVDNSKEIVEKYKKKIGNLPGPQQRLKCIHIVHNKDARPEEVMAAIQFMTESYGHLYAEDIKEFQSEVNEDNIANKEPGYFAFLDAFIITTKLGNLTEWRKKAYKKAKPEIGKEGEPTEEMLLHALFKSIDGDWSLYPYAASVVKAIGGPGGFERGWKIEGTKNAIQKGKDQTIGVNAQGRLDKAVGYLATHEFYKGIGSMEKVAGKIKSPSFQAFPFIWAVGGYTKHTSASAREEIKAYAGKGYSFHAYSFMRKESDNAIYRATVQLALAELIRSGKISDVDVLKKFNKICDRIDHGPESSETTKKKYGGINPPAAMMDFWQQYADTGLHDMLQGHDGWLIKMAKENATVEKYAKILSGSHDEILSGATVPGTDIGGDWYNEHGLGTSIIFHRQKDTGLQSISHTLRKIKFPGTNRGGRPMDKEHEERMWAYLIGELRNNKDISRWYGDAQLQKRQYFLWRRELIDYFTGALGATSNLTSEEIRKNLGTFSYFRDFEKMGIDPMAIFDSSLIDANEEEDYQAWLSGGRETTSTVDIVSSVQGKSRQVVGGERAPNTDTSWADTDTPTGPSRSHAADIPSEDSDN